MDPTSTIPCFHVSIPVPACRNVLVGKNNSVKISDFGLSRALAKDDSYYKLSQTLKLPVKWMALESLLYQKFSTYSDGIKEKCS